MDMARQSTASRKTEEETEAEQVENLPSAPQQRSMAGVNDRNAFETYGDQASQRSIVGTLLKFSKGDWLAGEDQSDVEVGTEFVANMDQLMVGWIKWVDNKPVEQIMGPVAEGFQPPRRNTLGDENDDEWEVDEATQKPRDPWQFSNYIIFEGKEDGALYTFATSSRGGLGAIGELCKHYGKEMRQRPEEYPVIEIGTAHYQHRDKKIGRIYVPTFKIVGWSSKADFADIGGGSADEEAVQEAKPAKSGKAASPKKK